MIGRTGVSACLADVVVRVVVAGTWRLGAVAGKVVSLSAADSEETRRATGFAERQRHRSKGSWER